MIALDIAQAVFQNLRKPSQQKLPWQTLLRAASDCQKRLLREAQLSDRGWLERFVDINPTDSDDLLNVYDFSIPTRVQYRVGDDDWHPVSLVNHDGFINTTDEAVAIYGTPPRIAYSGTSLDDGRQYRVWYETSPVALVELDQEGEMPEMFSDLWVDETVLYCIPLVDDDSEAWQRWLKLQLSMTLERVAESKRQWKRWVNMARENGIIYADGFQAGGCDGEAAYLGLDGYPRAS